MKIKAFTLRVKTSKQGKQYWVAPMGAVDLLAFQDAEGNIEVSYCEREATPATASPARPQAQPVQASRPVITPRQQPVKIIPRDAPHHRPAQPMPQDYVDHTRPPENEAPWPEIDEIPF